RPPRRASRSGWSSARSAKPLPAPRPSAVASRRSATGLAAEPGLSAAEILLEPLRQIVFPEFDANPYGVVVFSGYVEIRRDAIVVVEPFAQFAQGVGQFPPFQTQFDLAHRQPAVHYCAPGFPNPRTTP